MSQRATPDTNQTPDPDHIKTTLQAVAARSGKVPTVVDLHNDPQTNLHPEQVVDEYGSWDAALEAAGLDPEEMGSKQIPDRELLAELQRLAQDLDRSPTQEDMADHGQYSDTTYQNRFGSWNNALEQAMLDTREISDDELRRELRDLAAELEKVPEADDMDDYGEYSAVTYHRRFGSWLDALDEAGLLQ